MDQNREEIPELVIRFISDELGSYYFSHRKIEDIFLHSGAPEDIPNGNCVDKCANLLRAINKDKNLVPFQILGKIIEDIMEKDFHLESKPEVLKMAKKNIKQVLEKKGYTYIGNGQISGANITSSVKALSEIIKSKDLRGVETEFNRCLENIEKDPPASLTGACSLLEALFKVYIEENNVTLPKKETIKELWKVIQHSLNFKISNDMDEDIKRILSGMSSIVDGVGSLRTHKGSAHGRKEKKFLISSRHARLAIHAAHTLAVFVIETWIEKSKKS